MPQKAWVLGTNGDENVRTPLVKLLVFLVKFYQGCISPFKRPCCRFYPSCSDYAIQALQKYGAFKGLRLAIIRVLKCHPFHPGGYDPV